MNNIEVALWNQMQSGNVECSMMGDTNDSEELTPALFALAKAVKRWPMWDDSKPDGEQDAVCVPWEAFERIVATNA